MIISNYIVYNMILKYIYLLEKLVVNFITNLLKHQKM
jgi:hypothetical protein